MTEIAIIIILYSVLKLFSYGAWNLKNKNISGLIGVFLLEVGLIFYLISLINKILF